MSRRDELRARPPTSRGQHAKPITTKQALEIIERIADAFSMSVDAVLGEKRTLRATAARLNAMREMRRLGCGDTYIAFLMSIDRRSVTRQLDPRRLG